MEKKFTGGINIGTSSILVTFVLLALVTFSALSYTTAKSDYTLSKENADRTASYYDANRMAEIYMANIENLLSRLEENVDNADDYYAQIEGLFADNDRIDVRKDAKGVISLNYSIVVTEGQNLEVSLIPNYPTEDDPDLFHIDRWATGVNQEWLQKINSGETEDSGVKLLF